MNTVRSLPAATGRRAQLLRWLGLALETHIALPLFALPLLAAIWLAALHAIDADGEATRAAARKASRELADTYEAQMARSLAGIDQTLKVLKYAVELRGAAGGLPELRARGLLPPGLVFSIAVADRDGRVVASSPRATVHDVSQQPYFAFHRGQAGDGLAPFISHTVGDATGAEPHVRFTRRINDSAGRFGGVAIVEVEPAYFTSAYERSREGVRGLLALVRRDGAVCALRVGDELSWDERIAIPGHASDLQLALHDGVERYIGIRPLNGFPLTVVAGVALDEQMLPHRQRRASWLAAAGAASAVLLLVVAFVSMWAWQLSRARRRVRRAQETYAAASEASIDAFFVLRTVRDAHGKVLDFRIEDNNARAAALAGMGSAALRGNLLCELVPVCRTNGIFAGLERAVNDGVIDQAEWEGDIPHLQGRWLQRQVVPVDGGVVATVRDITERKLAEARIFNMAHHDELTGLPNRSLLRDRLEHALKAAERDGRHLALAFIDLDGFKLVNDGLGHNAGDELLRVVGARMLGCVRRTDTLARFGGDEFVIVLPDLDDNPAALAPLLDRVCKTVAEPLMVEGQAVQVSCSIGVALYPRDGLDPDTLMSNADAAMYRAKELGRNNFQFYAREMNASVEDKLALLEGLRQAIDATLAAPEAPSQFQLLYQPKVDLRSGRVFGVEAVIRWQHPEHGLVGPQRFIGLAEESGLIVPIGEWVLRTACRQNQSWRDAGLAPITISVNVSARQFEEQRLVERVADALRESGLAPDALELEVTESLIMRDLAKSVGKMRELKAMGLSLSIDDFGTGYSSLSALKSFPISRLKIDKSFVSELADNPDDQAIALAVISLGHKLHLRVIAEGVETEQQRAFLRANDCDEMQGYLFSKPVPAWRITELLACQRPRGGQE